MPFRCGTPLYPNTFAQRCKLGARGMMMGDIELRRLSSSRIGWKAVASLLREASSGMPDWKATRALGNHPRECFEG